jgi:hypothetical protein
MYIDTLLNQRSNIQAFIDSGCLCFATVSEHLVRRFSLATIPIKPRSLEQVVTQKNPPQISQLAIFRLDIGGFEEEIYAYVVPHQQDPLILDIGWIKRHDASIRPQRNKIKIRLPIPLHITATSETAKRTTRHNLLSQLASIRAGGLQIYAASLEDIQKALQEKTYPDPRKEAPSWLAPILHVFDRQAAKTLPPYRPGLDHSIELRKGETVPAMPLYSMSRDELLVLRKTLTELLEQGFIRPSRSAAGAPVLFVKKPGSGLRFCVDFRGLNAITINDSYPLPLISETLRDISSARWVSKVDIISAFWRLRIRKGDEWKTAFRTRLGS